MQANAVELRGLTKSFGSVRANSGIHLQVRKGSIHGVIGENGAGKSTAMKMLYGQYRPDSGDIFIHGKPIVYSSPIDAIRAGIGMVHQHFMLAEPYSVLDNILLGVSLNPMSRMDRKRSLDRLKKLAKQYSLEVSDDAWQAPVETLPVGVQQRIEILKLLFRDAQILILDEPTAVLTPQETDRLFENLKRLRDEGKTILIVTHKLREVMAITDVVTVFRAGQVVGDVKTADSNPQELANMMVGRKVALRVEAPAAKQMGAPALDMNSIPLGHGQLASLKVHSGEIVGIAGVEGNGQTELIRHIWFSELKKGASVGLIPEDRIKEGLLRERNLLDNYLLGRRRDPEFSRWGFLNFPLLRASAQKEIQKFDVRPNSLDAIAGRLSGGNQQKLIFARELQNHPRFIIAAQPTRGVDVGAIEFIHQQLIAERDSGAGILLLSSELDEVMSLSDRLLVLYEGRFIAEFQRGSYHEEKIGLAMGGAA